MQKWGYAAALLTLSLAFVVLWPGGRFSPAPIVSTASYMPDGDALARFRLDRLETREKEIAQLNAILEDASGADAIRQEARRQLLALTEYMECETTIEGVLRARGFTDVVATVHASSVNVLVRAESLTQTESAVILELAMRESGQAAGNIKIIPIE